MIQSKKTFIKVMLMLISLSCPVGASAYILKVFYNKDSPLPLPLRQKIANTITQNCEAYSSDTLSLKEIATQVHVKQDESATDYYYTTTFTSYADIDSGPPVEDVLTVESEQFEVSNPTIDPHKVNRVSSLRATCY